MYNICGVMTFFEYYVTTVAHVANVLKLLNISPEASEKTRNKFLMRESLNLNNIPTPKYKLVECCRSYNENWLSKCFKTNKFSR